MANFCLKGREMLLDLKRSDWLPHHDDEGIRNITTEVNKLQEELEKMMAQWDGESIPDNVKIKIHFFHQSLQRNHRLLDSYNCHRLQKIRDVRWEVGAVLPQRAEESLSAHEKNYFARYSTMVTEVNERYGFDLGADLEPPKSLLIEVRALEDCGTVMTDSGPVNLSKGSMHFLRRSHVEQFIREGRVEHILHDASY